MTITVTNVSRTHHDAAQAGGGAQACMRDRPLLEAP